MSSVFPVGPQGPASVSGLEPTSSASPPPVAYLQGTLDTVSGMLSMPTDSVRASLKQGSSISDLAAQSGVGRDSIVQAVQQQVQQLRAAQGRSPIDPSILSSTVERAVDRRRGYAPANALDPLDRTTPTTLPTTDSGSSIDLLA